jgi:hypothetical protein
MRANPDTTSLRAVSARNPKSRDTSITLVPPILTGIDSEAIILFDPHGRSAASRGRATKMRLLRMRIQMRKILCFIKAMVWKMRKKSTREFLKL